MNTRQFLQYESVINCQHILGDRKFRHPEIDSLRPKFDEATDALRQLWHAQEVAHTTRSSDSGQLRRMRGDLRKRLLRVTRRAIVLLDGVPGIRDDLRVPHANVRDAELLKAGARIVRNLRPHLRTLHDTGLPADTMQNLIAAMKALKAKSANPDTAIARRSRATASLPNAIRRAREIAKALDSVVKADLDFDANVRWADVYRIPRKRGRPKLKRGRSSKGLTPQ